MTRQIDVLWGELSARREFGGALRVDDSHPCDLYAALDPEGHQGLVLITDIDPPLPPSLESMTITSGPRLDGRFSLAFWLQDPELLPPFVHLCQDLVEQSRAIEPRHAAAFLLTRLSRWRRLLRAERGLSLSELRGIAGEILVLQQCLDLWPAQEVIDGWVGPLGAAQDFIFSGLRIESKAVEPDSRVIAISSADQLDLGSRTLLAVVTMATRVAGDGNLTLRDLTAHVSARLSASGELVAADLFAGRLSAAGYDDDDPNSNLGLRVDSFHYYEVRDGFPVIGRPDLPKGIAEVRYDIELAAIRPFLTHLSA